MKLKYRLTGYSENSFLLGIQYDLEKHLVTIGGKKKFIPIIFTLLKEYFDCINGEFPEPKKIQKNKWRYSINCSQKKFFKFISDLERSGSRYIVERVSALKDIMR